MLGRRYRNSVAEEDGMNTGRIWTGGGSWARRMSSNGVDEVIRAYHSQHEGDYSAHSTPHCAAYHAHSPSSW